MTLRLHITFKDAHSLPKERKYLRGWGTISCKVCKAERKRILGIFDHEHHKLRSQLLLFFKETFIYIVASPRSTKSINLPECLLLDLHFVLSQSIVTNRSESVNYLTL